jgi:lipopolysaccharide transport system ATP-binding protein
MPVAIKVENLSKAYQLGEFGTGTVSKDLERWLAKVRGKEDPFLKVGETNDRSVKGTSNVVWSLKGLDFEIAQGEAVGIIGRNGAGKSTLLKILSRVTSPTAGVIKAKGRIASLLEVGTGFHPELTGKENIYLNGAILGMRKTEIDKKLDQIIDFSGVERYIDTPVKRYSSGMYVRLAFAVAAHLESEILIVDEVLAVGDAEFQKKCLGKMGEVSRGEGRTILFVSHNMQAVSTLCRKLILLKNGEIAYNGNVKDGLNFYLTTLDSLVSREQILASISRKKADETFDLLDFTVEQEGSDGFELVSNKPIRIRFTYLVKKTVIGLRVGFDLIEKSNDIVLFRTFHDDASESVATVQPGNYFSEVVIDGNLLKQGSYLINIAIGIHNIRWIIFDLIKVQININNIDGVNRIYADDRPGVLMPDVAWRSETLNHGSFT